MNETNNISSANETSSAPSVENNETQQAPPVKSSKRERKARRKAQLGAKGADKNTSKIRKRAFSTLVVKARKKGRHVLVVTDKKGAETFATGRNELSRAAKINAVLIDAGRPLTLAQIREKLDALYGADHVKALSNHMRALLVKGAATLKEGAYTLKTKKAPAPVVESAETNDAPQSE